MSTETNLKLDVLTPRGRRTARSNCPPRSSTRRPTSRCCTRSWWLQQAAARQGTPRRRPAPRSAAAAWPYRQKGTGRARQGSTRAPHFTGGGVVHGPQPRDYSQRTPKKMKAAALRGALSDRARNDRIHVITELVAGQTLSTKPARLFLEKLSDRRNFLVVLRARMTPHGAAWPTSGTSTRSRPIS